MQKRDTINRQFKFLMYLVVVVLINVAGTTLFFRIDMTANKVYSLSEASKQTVATLSDPLTIKVFFTENLPAPYNNIERYLRDLLEEYSLAGSETENPEYSAIQEENKKFVWDGFNHLSSDIRMAVILRDIQGKKYEEIAEIMELPLGTVKSRVNRGRLQLAKILKEKKEKGEQNGM